MRREYEGIDMVGGYLLPRRSSTSSRKRGDDLKTDGIKQDSHSAQRMVGRLELRRGAEERAEMPRRQGDGRAMIMSEKMQ